MSTNRNQKGKNGSSRPPKQGGRGPRPGGAWTDQDAEFQQEQGRYADPIPSRSHILKTLSEQQGPVTLDDLVGVFGLSKLSQQEALNKRLVAMSREGQVVQNRNGAYGPVAQMNLIAGSVQAHRDGFGFLIPDAGGPDVFLPPRQMRALMNGDRVLVRVTGTDFKGRPEGAVSEVIERVSRTIVGRLHMDKGVSYVIPENPRITQDLLIPPESRKGAKHGQMVVADIVTPPGDRTLAMGEVKEILGQHLAPGMEIEAAIRAHSLPFEWPEAVEREAAGIADTVQPQQMAGREDIRDLPLVTIDGADARDFDDAVYAKPIKRSLLNKGGWTLWVAIADVAAYVKPDSPLDKEASKRGNSVYFPQRVIPMLPEKLSNGLCSINPDVDRLCMVCEMRVMPDGEVAKARFFEGVMRSKARLIYDDVAEMLENPQGEKAQKRAALLPHLQALKGVFEALFKARERRGAIDFESTETKIVFSGERKIDRIVPVQRNLAHRLIEECMIAANVESAKLVEKHKMPNLYRIHEQPDALKVAALREFLSLQAMKLGGGDKPAAMDFAKALEKAKGRPDQMLIQTVMLRSLMQAKYNPVNHGHFGLALTHYAHFTSPIRRYPDLLLHRAIKHILQKGKPRDFTYSNEQMEAQGTHCSMTERRADEATRDVNTWLKCEFMRHRIGEDFNGVISSVAAFGLFIELEGMYIDGLAHVSTLKNDYYEHDKQAHRLVGRASGMAYSIGDRVRVKLVRVDLDERKIDLELLGNTQTGGGQRQKPRSQDRRSEPVQPASSKSHPPKSKSRSRRGKR